MEVPSDVKLLRTVSKEIEGSLEKRGVNGAILFDIRLSVEEALRNAMVHGNKSDKSVPVRIEYKIDADKIVIEIEDKGSGFMERDVADPTKDENLYKKGGRGVLLIRKSMDEVRYDKKGSLITMVKYFKKGKKV